jgi:hypothetical protein
MQGPLGCNDGTTPCSAKGALTNQAKYSYFLIATERMRSLSLKVKSKNSKSKAIPVTGLGGL